MTRGGLARARAVHAAAAGAGAGCLMKKKPVIFFVAGGGRAAPLRFFAGAHGLQLSMCLRRISPLPGSSASAQHDVGQVAGCNHGRADPAFVVQRAAFLAALCAQLAGRKHCSTIRTQLLVQPTIARRSSVVVERVVTAAAA